MSEILLNSLDWFAEYKKFDFKEVTIEGVYLNYVALTEEQKELVGDESSAGKMLSSAADFGMSKGRDRFSDDDDDAQNIDVFWAKPELTVELEVSIKHQFGKLVCEASGLSELIEKTQEQESIEAQEKARKEVEALENEASADNLEVGAHTIPANVDVEDLEADADNYLNVAS